LGEHGDFPLGSHVLTKIKIPCSPSNSITQNEFLQNEKRLLNKIILN